MAQIKREENYAVQQPIEEPVEMDEVLEDLFFYVRTDNIEEVKRLIEYEPSINDINVKDENGNTLLHFACANNHVNMILFLLYECSINYNEMNYSGNSPLLWAIQNKRYDAVKQILFFDYYLNKNEYIKMEKKNHVYQNEVESQGKTLKKEYVISDIGKKKIGTINMYNLYENASGEENQKLKKYKEYNKIELFKKNAYNKDILSEAFNTEDENILHLILSHPMSHVLDNPNTGDDTNIATKLHLDTQEKLPSRKDTEKEEERQNTNSDWEQKNEKHKTSEKQVNHVEIGKDEKEYKYDEDSLGGSLNGDMTTDLEKAQIVQEKVQKLLINKNARWNDQDIIIKIREIGLNYYGDCLSNQENKNDLTGIIIWEGCLLASKWLSELCLNNFFANKKEVLEIGSGTGLASISVFLYSSYANKNEGLNRLVISDINSFTLENIRHNINLNKHILDMADPNWQNKISVCHINWGDQNTYLKNEKNEIILYDCIIGSDLIYDIKIADSLIDLISSVLKKNGVFLYACRKNRSGVDFFYEQLRKNNFQVQFLPLKDEYFENPFLNMDRDLFDLKFSDMSDRDFVITVCQKM